MFTYLKKNACNNEFISCRNRLLTVLFKNHTSASYF